MPSARPKCCSVADGFLSLRRIGQPHSPDIHLVGNTRKPACTKCRSVANAVGIPSSFMITKLVQSVKEKALSFWRKNATRARSWRAVSTRSQRNLRLAESWTHPGRGVHEEWRHE